MAMFGSLAMTDTRAHAALLASHFAPSAAATPAAHVYLLPVFTSCPFSLTRRCGNAH